MGIAGFVAIAGRLVATCSLITRPFTCWTSLRRQEI